MEKEKQGRFKIFSGWNGQDLMIGMREREALGRFQIYGLRELPTKVQNTGLVVEKVPPLHFYV